MRKDIKLFCTAVFLEAVVQFFIGLLCIYYLYWELTIPNIEILSSLIRLTIIIAIVIMPLEAILLKSHINKCKNVGIVNGIPLAQQKKRIRKYLQRIQIAFAVLWFAHSGVFELVAVGRMQLHRSMEMYMVLGRPGHIIIFLSLLGVVIADLILNGTHTE